MDQNDAPMRDFATSLLMGLPPSDMAGISPHLSRRTFPAGATIIKPGSSNECHFIRRGLVAVLFGPHDAEPVGVSLLGFDDFLGIAELLGAGEATHSAVALTSCSTLCLTSDDLRRACEAHHGLRRRLLQYAYLRTTDAMQAAACHLRHALEPRLAAWILRAADLLQERSIHITHHRLAFLLGVRRPTMTVALQNLEGRRAIWSERRRVTIRDRLPLEQLACSCYVTRQTLSHIH
jgi:CRP-like cAMP-binding protein